VSAISKPALAHKLFFSREWPTSGHVSQQYERVKAAWIADHPDATSQEYEQAIREIAARLNY
jgi:hypothetical protein